MKNFQHESNEEEKYRMFRKKTSKFHQILKLRHIALKAYNAMCRNFEICRNFQFS